MICNVTYSVLAYIILKFQSTKIGLTLLQAKALNLNRLVRLVGGQKHLYMTVVRLNK